MRISLSSLAPNSFILGPEDAVRQFLPEKVFDTERPALYSGRLPTRNGLSQPWAVEIHPTSRCELRCWHCSYKQRNKDRQELSALIMHRLLNELNDLGISSLIFSGGGEPLAWGAGRLGDYIRGITGYRCSVATNGLALMRGLDRDSLRRLSVVQININGFDETTFAQTTGTQLFSTFRENLLWLFANRDKEVTQVTGKILVNRENYRKIDEYLEFCTRLGFDVVVIKLAGNFEQGQDVELDEKQKEEVKSILATSPFAALYAARIDAIATSDNTVEIPLPEKCWVVELGLYLLVRSNGDLFPCVASPFTRENRMGNLYDYNLSEIWGSDAHQEIRSKLHRDMKNGKCKLTVCRHLRYNYAIQAALNSPTSMRGPLPSGSKPKLL